MTLRVTDLRRIAILKTGHRASHDSWDYRSSSSSGMPCVTLRFTDLRRIAILKTGRRASHDSWVYRSSSPSGMPCVTLRVTDLRSTAHSRSDAGANKSGGCSHVVVDTNHFVSDLFQLADHFVDVADGQ